MSFVEKEDNRIHLNKQYQRVFSSGRKCVGYYVVLIISKNNLNISRFGIITSKKVGKAHMRNFAKRRLRELIRIITPKVQPGYDIVVIARNSIAKVEFNKLARDFEIQLKKVKLL